MRDIHVENLIPRLVVDVEGIGKRHKPRIVHQDVDAATQSQRRLDDPLWGVVVRHIGRYRDGPAADRPHLSGRLLEAFRIPAHQNEIRPPVGKCFGDVEADSHTRAGHNAAISGQAEQVSGNVDEWVLSLNALDAAEFADGLHVVPMSERPSSNSHWMP